MDSCITVSRRHFDPLSDHLDKLPGQRSSVSGDHEETGPGQSPVISCQGGETAAEVHHYEDEAA